MDELASKEQMKLLTAEELDPALHRLRWLRLLHVFQSLVQQNIPCRGVRLTDHLHNRPDQTITDRIRPQ